MTGSSPASTDVSAWLDAARTMAADAGKILLNRYGGPCRIERKGVVDLVTEADRASEACLLGALRERFPEHSVLAEESAGTEWKVLADARIGAEAPLWLIDPLDGTTNFAHGFPWFCVSIGVAV
ncbi:MAG: inositol monophosphatase, partial [Nitrospirae bacterium]|nr:inositol monophosphatase [Nitrospirota bacterium]